MANVLKKIENVVSGAMSIKNIASTVSSSGLLNGISLKDIDPNNIGAIGEKIKANITSASNGIMGDITSSASALDTGAMENVMSSITPSDLGIDLNELKQIPGFDPSMLDGISFR